MQRGAIISFKLFSFLVLALLWQSNYVAAANVGISPGAITFNDMLRGGYAERDVTVSIDTGKNVYVSIIPFGDIKEWINVSKNITLITPAEKRDKIKIIIRPPINTPNGFYNGGVKFRTSGLGDIDEGQIGTVVSASVDLQMGVEIIDVEIVQCRASGFSVHSVEEGETIEFFANVKNDGNVVLQPDVIIDIWDQEQENIVKFVTWNDEEILQTSESYFSVPLDSSNLPPGQYWAEVSVPACFVEDFLLTFDVLEEGSLSAEGLLVKIITPVWTELGETIPISAIFENTGERTIDAQFKGHIERQGKIIDLLESEELRVAVRENTSFDFFYTPKKIGRYIVKGRVFYNKKRTFELSSIFNITGQPKRITLTSAILFIILAISAYFLWKIQQEKKQKQRKKKKYY